MIYTRTKNFLDLYTVKNKEYFNFGKKDDPISSKERSYRTMCIDFNNIPYFEVQITNSRGACRVGFSESSCNPLTPLGTDTSGFSFGSKNGYRFNNSKRRVCGPEAVKDDIISCMFRRYNPLVKAEPEVLKAISSIKRELRAASIDPIHSENIISNTDSTSAIRPQKCFNIIEFFLNGQLLDGGFVCKAESHLFPAVSLFDGCEVKIILGSQMAYKDKIDRYLQSLECS